MISLNNKLHRLYINFKYKPIKPLAYLHIPKTGGTYLGQLDKFTRPVLSPFKYLGHSYIVDSPNDINIIRFDKKLATTSVISRKLIANYYIFSTVRNIYDWLVSYTSFAAGWKYKNGNPGHYDYDVATKGFDYLVNTIANREDIWPNRKFIHCQLFSSNGDLIVDWLNRTDRLDTGLQQLASKFKLYYKKRNKQKVSNRQNYQHYYNNRLVDIVSETWSREINLFGFSFEDKINNKCVLSNEISVKNKEHVKYYYHNNTLINDDVIID
jgi:hypothetical protein